MPSIAAPALYLPVGIAPGDVMASNQILTVGWPMSRVARSEEGRPAGLAGRVRAVRTGKRHRQRFAAFELQSGLRLLSAMPVRSRVHIPDSTHIMEVW